MHAAETSAVQRNGAVIHPEGSQHCCMSLREFEPLLVFLINWPPSACCWFFSVSGSVFSSSSGSLSVSILVPLKLQLGVWVWASHHIGGTSPLLPSRDTDTAVCNPKPRLYTTVLCVCMWFSPAHTHRAERIKWSVYGRKMTDNNPDFIKVGTLWFFLVIPALFQGRILTCIIPSRNMTVQFLHHCQLSIFGILDKTSADGVLMSTQISLLFRWTTAGMHL